MSATPSPERKFNEAAANCTPCADTARTAPSLGGKLASGAVLNGRAADRAVCSVRAGNDPDFFGRNPGRPALGLAGLHAPAGRQLRRPVDGPDRHSAQRRAGASPDPPAAAAHSHRRAGRELVVTPDPAATRCVVGAQGGPARQQRTDGQPLATRAPAGRWTHSSVRTGKPRARRLPRRPPPPDRLGHACGPSGADRPRLRRGAPPAASTGRYSRWCHPLRPRRFLAADCTSPQ